MFVNDFARHRQNESARTEQWKQLQKQGSQPASHQPNKSRQPSKKGTNISSAFIGEWKIIVWLDLEIKSRSKHLQNIATTAKVCWLRRKHWVQTLLHVFFVVVVIVIHFPKRQAGGWPLDIRYLTTKPPLSKNRH